MAENRAANVNGDEDEDEALRIAIALSLGQDPNSASIDLTQDDPAPEQIPEPLPPAISVPAPAQVSGIAGLDRKRMEEERIARLNKRKAAELGSPTMETARPQQRQKTTTNDAPKSPIVSTGGLGSAPTTTAAPLLPFPKGVVKKTWVYGQRRLGDDIKIEEVLQKDKLEIAVISSFQWDEEWMLSKLDMTRTKLTLVAFANNEAQQEEIRNNVPKSLIRFCFPPMSGSGYMHSKLQLLRYSNYLRIVIPTGNFVPYDWGETGVMENMVFIIDLPLLETVEQRKAQKLTPFAEDLVYFLSAQGLDESLINSLQKFDFSETSRYAFVHSIAGPHTEGSWRRTGYCGLGRAVSGLGLACQGKIELDVVTASIGAVNYDLLRGLYFACQGDSGLKQYQLRTARLKARTIAGGDDDTETLDKHIRVYFPSLQTVKESRGGTDAAGPLCFQSQWWSAESFPRKILRDCQSTRQGVLMHSKILFVRQYGSGTSGGRNFAYVGSANLSESAWGRLVKEKGGTPKLTCRNWECGVVIEAPPRSKGETNDSSSASSAEDLSIFLGRVPLPMKVPSVPLDGERRPWFFRDA
ncbi:tyrosyl-DNA phosphodiesterase-domain-containing protein [Podospora aff. communis PSN243]|uniref:Tyrosyl-DNA phosphodiesterase-domain-containing protein n=1 Tax=Podospora aff. communis PSN243 TaxID=3040156 RepID=A0AAV9H5D0_9PEZI|nr:tyrosyl-DNA phosphodiesterase-domain-containing protein [Podospora aff. communis PSN243]